MSHIVACYKWVLDEGDIRFHNDRTLDIKGAKKKISEYDRNAIQLAVALSEASGARPVGLTCGDGSAQQSFRDALSRGLAETFLVDITGAAEPNGVVTARALAKGVEAIGDVSYVICADASSDDYGRQTGARLAARLGLPYIGLVCEASLEGETLTVVRKLDKELETVQVTGPAVLSILPETIAPTIPGLKALVAAAKKPSRIFTAAELNVDLTPSSRTVDCLAYVMERKNILLNEDTIEKKVEVLLADLHREGVL